MRRVDHPRLIAALRQIEDSIDEAWRHLCTESGITAGTADERELAEVVLAGHLRVRMAGRGRRTQAADLPRLQLRPRRRTGRLCELRPGQRPQAQRGKALINQLSDDELERLLTPADLQPKGP